MDRNEPLPPEIELAQLLQRCAAHDPAAFRLLYDKTSPILFARLLRRMPFNDAVTAYIKESTK